MWKLSRLWPKGCPTKHVVFWMKPVIKYFTNVFTDNQNIILRLYSILTICKHFRLYCYTKTHLKNQLQNFLQCKQNNHTMQHVQGSLDPSMGLEQDMKLCFSNSVPVYLRQYVFAFLTTSCICFVQLEVSFWTQHGSHSSTHVSQTNSRLQLPERQIHGGALLKWMQCRFQRKTPRRQM